MGNCGFRTTKGGFTYHGSLEDCVELAKQRIEKLEKETPYIQRRFDEEEKRKDRHFKAISSAREFIYTAEKEIEKRKADAS